MSVLAAIGAWIASSVLKRATGPFIQRIFQNLLGTEDGRIRLAEIKAGTQAALAGEGTDRLKTLTDAKNARQSQKMNNSMFWILIAIMMGPPALMLWSVAIYNIAFWEHGWFPQDWSIADFPPSIKPWVQASIDFLYDPLGAPLGVGTAAIANRLAGRR